MKVKGNSHLLTTLYHFENQLTCELAVNSWHSYYILSYLRPHCYYSLPRSQSLKCLKRPTWVLLVNCRWRLKSGAPSWRVSRSTTSKAEQGVLQADLSAPNRRSPAAGKAPPLRRAPKLWALSNPKAALRTSQESMAPKHNVLETTKRTRDPAEKGAGELDRLILRGNLDRKSRGEGEIQVR